MGADWPVTGRRLYALAALGLSACSPWPPPQAATDYFQQKYSCPSERTTSVVSNDLAVHDFACSAPTSEWVNGGGCRDATDCVWTKQLTRCGLSPPAKVAADPERLALWKAREAKLWAVYDSYFTPVVEVSGCGKRVWYTWAWEKSSWKGGWVPKFMVLKSEEAPR